MSRSIAFTILAVLIVGSAAMAVNAQTTKPRETHSRPTDKGPDGAGGNQSASGAAESRRPGRLSVDNESVQGRYVSFVLDLPSCSVNALRAYNVTMFTDIRLPATDCRTASGGPTGRLELRGDGVRLRIHDSPTALVQASADNGSVEFVFVPQIIPEADGAGVAFAVGNLTGRLFPKNETSIVADGSMVSGSDVTMMLHPASGTSAERREIFDAIRGGKVGAETDVILENGSVVSETFTFDDVELKVRKSGEERFDFTVAGNLSEGRVFVTNFEPGAFDPERMRVDYSDVDADGDSHGVLIRKADTLQEVLDFEPGKSPVYFVFEDEAGWHAAVAVPTFSVHVFQVVGLPLQVVPLLLYGVVIGGLFFAAGGVGMVLERRARAR
jgi:hypothetical protein